MNWKIDIRYWLAAAVLLSGLTACEKEKEPEWRIDPEDGHYRKVVILYADGNNNLYHDIRTNINELAGSCFNITDYGRDAVVVYSHVAKKYSYPKHTEPSEPVLVKIRERQGRAVLDTLHVWPKETVSSDEEVLSEVLGYIKDAMPADEYDLIFSSHATGYLPDGYYEYSATLEQQFSGVPYYKSRMMRGPFPVVERERRPGRPMTKSVGASYIEGSSYEMDLKDFSRALPMKFHSIIFDCCLMGGVETAWELKDKCDMLVFSPTEIISEGMDYSSIGKNMLENPTALTGIAEDYFKKYMYHPSGGQWQSATIAVIDCSRLDQLAEACRPLIEKYREPLFQMQGSRQVQRYYTDNYHWFYDLKDIFSHAGCSADELAVLDNALEECIIYKNTTPMFLEIEISEYSGLSMYLPADKGVYGNAYLEDYYKDLAWNKAVGLVL